MTDIPHSGKVPILIVERDPLIRETYTSLLENALGRRAMAINGLEDYESAMHIEKKELSGYHMAILSMAPSSGHKELKIDGLPFAKKLKRESPATKLMVITDSVEGYFLYVLFTTLAPESILATGEYGSATLGSAILSVLKDDLVYSRSVLSYIRSSMKHDPFIDHLDRKLLHHLSKGLTLAELKEIIGLSRSGIERRKQRLAKSLGLPSSRTELLLEAAKEKGLI